MMKRTAPPAAQRMRSLAAAAATTAAGIALAGIAALGMAAPAHAQESGTVPPAGVGSAAGQQPGATTPPAGQPGAPGQQGPPPGVPPLPVLLGYADFMLTVDRPFAAEQIYKNILFFDHENAAALKGLKESKEAQKPTYTFLGHSYYDSEDTQLFAYRGGPILRFPGSRLTVTAGNGYYKNNNNPNNRRNPMRLDPGLVPSAEDNFPLHQTTFNILWELYSGKQQEHETSIFVSQKSYDAAPDRLLYDLHYTYITKPGREKFTIGTGRKDSFYQSQVNQFLAPESYFMVKQGITFYDFYGSVDYPFASKWDFSLNYRHFEYTDHNQRNNLNTRFLYRIKPTDPNKALPVWRLGLEGIVDEARFFTLTYGIPADFRSVSIMTDYVMLDRKLKYGVYASYPVWDVNFAAPAGAVGYVSTNINRDNEIYFKTVILQARNLSRSIYDYVIGVNTRF